MRTGSLTFTCVAIFNFCYPTQRYEEYPYTGNKRVTKVTKRRAKQRKIYYSYLALVLSVNPFVLGVCLYFLLILFSRILGLGLSKPVSPKASFFAYKSTG